MAKINFLIIVSFLLGCNTQPDALPRLGHKSIVNGVEQVNKIPNFTFLNQDSIEVTNKTFDGKLLIIDYFFTSCPTICPKVKKNQLKILEKIDGSDEVAMLSVSVDTKFDTPSRLKRYQEKLEIESPNWELVSGTKEEVYGKANGFFHIGMEDEIAPGGFNHDGRLVLVDKEGYIRAFCDGLSEKSVAQLMDKVQILLNEK